MNREAKPKLTIKTKKALFPISIDSAQFTTLLTVPALRPITSKYDEIIFLIADSLNLYNKACAVKDEVALQDMWEDFSRLKKLYFKQRRKWLRKVRKHIGEDHIKGKWIILGVDDLTDSFFFTIYRNLLTAFHTVKAFRQDVERTARKYCSRNTISVSPEIKRGLSEAYILEEIAINVRIRVLEKVSSEFYLGDYLPPVLGLYEGKYGIDVFTLAGVSNNDVQFDFFHLVRTASGLCWQTNARTGDYPQLTIHRRAKLKRAAA